MKLKRTVLLRELMATAGFNQTSLAMAARCSRQRIGQIVNDPTQAVSPEMAARIADILDVKMSALFAVPTTTRKTDKFVSQCDQPCCARQLA